VYGCIVEKRVINNKPIGDEDERKLYYYNCIYNNINGCVVAVHDDYYPAIRINYSRV